MDNPVVFQVEYCAHDEELAYIKDDVCIDQKRTKKCPSECPYKPDDENLR